ncbi:unnamed protein product [Didymodactylos carnosus]|uniref:Uncharacterized protein n=1 Tax=Didymodactylos carnosus TaxID=1234261 RepID=A0A815MV74_9BILA|nr:unnamed protein product [Didymodactylos carnosus]CAF1430073.1 unnamed protein product [Didymodactylos carnosus]CAF3745209.1 unnamed protein product [Didymodactylos carnosus]CAF4309102.1 unnamed protein product [Didymodactylos carnosus]
MIEQNEQYLVTLHAKPNDKSILATFQHYLDMETWFRTFTHLIFIVLDIDKMHHRVRELLLNEQDSLSRQNIQHAEVYYFSRELTCRKGMKPYIILRTVNADVARSQLNKNFYQFVSVPPKIRVIVGAAGIGKY